MMKTIAVMALIITAVAGLLPGCSRAEQPPATPQPLTGEKKVLIVYLSRTDNTRAIAEFIHQKVGGTIVALELEKPYPADYRAIVEQVAHASLPTSVASSGVSREELMAKALELWPRGVIEEALGAEAESVLPHAVRLVELRARIPRYQMAMLEYFAERERTTVSDVLTHELEGVASEHAGELSAVIPDFAFAFEWPEAGRPCSGAESSTPAIGETTMILRIAGGKRRDRAAHAGSAEVTAMPVPR